MATQFLVLCLEIYDIKPVCKWTPDGAEVPQNFQ